MDYNSSSLIVGQLKEILHDFNLPFLPVLTENTRLRKGKCYIKDNKIVKCIKADYKEDVVNNISCGEHLDDYKLEVVGEYVYNKPLLNITKNLLINSSYYDNYTHEYLGDYLRFLRDYHKLDLMCMYNCFGRLTPKKIVKNYKIKSVDGKDFYFNIDTTDVNYKYYIIPVKFDTVYTVAIDSNVKYEMACIFYNNKIIDTPLELIRGTYNLIQGSRYNKPFLFSTKCPDLGKNTSDSGLEIDLTEKAIQNENSLYILLKLSANVNSSITFLEGNYCNCSNVIDNRLITNFIYNDDHFPSNYISKLSLLRVNNNKSYPFSNRLVEYLSGNVITNIDDISTNIERVQDIIYKDSLNGYYGIWDDKLRNNIYKKYFSQDKTRLSNVLHGNKILVDTSEGVASVSDLIRTVDLYSDLTGFVDKDTEKMLNIEGGN